MRVAVAGGTGVVGRHTVAALRTAGHEAVVLSRSTGADVLTGSGLVAALAGCAAVVDVTSVQTTSGRVSREFFGTATRTLLSAEREADVPHHVVLSIVGATEAPSAYYAGKALQERLVRESGTGWSILRATQFHEFAAQLVGDREKRLHLVPVMRSQPVAAAEVGEALAAVATGAPRGLDRDLGGPKVEEMPDLVRRYLAATGRRGRVLAVPLPGRWGRALRDGTILAGPDAQLGEQTFAEWLTAQVVRGAPTGP
ncbi:nucleoside-diphosphate sugar epimerase [Leifsonia sp. LS1]|uniref:SDR family oxidoreductase n=1 Tax=Leifsonia sp. LS1 TaxID=2828483 RepID=UPI001CFC9A83|nr:SDR family oxidoreductase [Leifsonia sp. LS1]GIT78777.1 nucleoside-diphosphate sugar epimerase [Leifsonia sp. LS1]